MAGQAALLTRQEVKSTIKSIECDKGKTPGGGKQSKKMSSQSKPE
jgi:hypothetical protein